MKLEALFLGVSGYALLFSYLPWQAVLGIGLLRLSSLVLAPK